MGKINKPAKKQEKPPPAPFLRKAYQVGIILIINCILFLPTLRYEFIGLDDTLLIVQNADYLKQTSNIFDAFKHDVFYNPGISQEVAKVYYRPLLTISFMLDTALGGQDPFVYHLTNIVLHMASCVLVLWLLNSLSIAPLPSFWGALVFALHPVLSQAVSWVPGRNDSLLAVFVLSSMIFFIRYLRTLRTPDLILHALFFGLGLFTKETAIVTPFIAFAYYLIYVRKGEIPRRLWWSVLMYLLVLGIWHQLRAGVIAQSKADLSFPTLMGSFIRNFPVYFQTLQKIILPLNLSLLSTPEDTDYVLFLIVATVLGALILFSRNVSWKKVLFGFLWFNAFLLPAFMVHILTGLEHRVYLPLVGFLIILSETDLLKGLSLKPSYRLYFSGAFLALLFVVNLFHVRSFQSGFEYWKKAAANSPHSSLAKLNYGARLANQDKLEEALTVYLAGMKINPAEPKLHNNIGVIYARTGKRDLAEQEFKKEIEINPRYSDAYFNLGILYSEKGDWLRMEEMWQRTLEIDPNHEAARKFLNNYLKKRRSDAP